MFVLESRDDLGRRLVFPLVKVRTTIGRDPNCDIVLDDQDVSRRHARVYVMGEQVKIKDEGSANGTFVNNVAIADLTDMATGSELIVGSNQFFLRRAEDAPAEGDDLQLTTVLSIDQLREMTRSFASLLDDTPEPSEDIAATVLIDKKEMLENIYHKKIAFQLHPSLEVLFGADKGKRYMLTPGEHRIGRGANCNVRLNDPMVSGLHGTIEVTDGKVVYTDEQSKNGSILNNKIVTTHPLQNRDVLVLGNTKLKFVHPKQGSGRAIADAPLPLEPAGAVVMIAQWAPWVLAGVAAGALVIVLLKLFVLR
jgi:pSer/pThr/pTyr-binding forkhead associated (FHA) protein